MISSHGKSPTEPVRVPAMATVNGHRFGTREAPSVEDPVNGRIIVLPHRRYQRELL